MIDLIGCLTYKIDQYRNIEWGTTNDIKQNLWQDINKLRNNNNKRDLMNNWEYKHAFEFTENSHMNNRKMFRQMPWEDSFALTLLFSIYH
jgi:hypothetical protein